MGIRRALTGAVLGLAGSALLALPAAAAAPDPYGPDPTPGNLGTSSTTVEPGEAVTISGSGFAPNSTITITVTVTPSGFGRRTTESAPAPMGSLLAAGTTRTVAATTVQGFAAQTVTANAAGSFTAQVTLTQAGTNVISATGVDPDGNPRTLTTVVFVAAAGGVGGVGGDDNGTGTGTGSGGGSASGVGGLPNTGADLKVPVILGGTLVLLGGGAAIAGRRRKQRTGAAA